MFLEEYCFVFQQSDGDHTDQFWHDVMCDGTYHTLCETGTLVHKYMYMYMYMYHTDRITYTSVAHVTEHCDMTCNINKFNVFFHFRCSEC